MFTGFVQSRANRIQYSIDLEGWDYDTSYPTVQQEPEQSFAHFCRLFLERATNHRLQRIDGHSQIHHEELGSSFIVHICVVGPCRLWFLVVRVGETAAFGDVAHVVASAVADKSQ